MASASTPTSWASTDSRTSSASYAPANSWAACSSTDRRSIGRRSWEKPAASAEARVSRSATSRVSRSVSSWSEASSLELGSTTPSCSPSTCVRKIASGVRKLVGDIGREHPPQPVFLLDRVGHGVEGDRHLAELVGSLEVHAARPVAGSQIPRGTGELARGSGRPPCQDDTEDQRDQAREDPAQQQQPVHGRPERDVLRQKSRRRLADDRRPDRGSADDDGHPLRRPERPAPHHLPVHRRHLTAGVPHRLPARVDEPERSAIHDRERLKRLEVGGVPPAHPLVGVAQRRDQLLLARLLLLFQIGSEPRAEREVHEEGGERGGEDADSGERRGQAKRERSTHRAWPRACSRPPSP